MQRTFSHTLLITWAILFIACNTHYVQTSVESRNMEVSDALIPIDSQFVKLYLPYKMELERDMKRVISFSQEEMVKRRPESNLTNFLADLLLEEGGRQLQILGRDIQPDISYFNYGGIRTFLPKGNITVGKIFELMPFENEMVFLQLRGDQVQDFLNYIAGIGGDSLGGVRFRISGRRATGVEIGGEPLRSDSHYWLVTNDYVASGGDGLVILSERSEFLSGNIKIRDVIISHLEKIQQKGEVISVRKDGRITYE